MSKPSLRITPAMGAAVIAHLRKITPLPGKGLIAGQAVSSAVMDLLGAPCGGVYNDVDLFISHKDLEAVWMWYHMGALAEGETPPMWKFKQVRQQFSIFASQASQNGYGELGFSGRSLYRVISSHREGMLNIVACEFMSTENQQQLLLKGFDLNCVQVGVNLETQELFFTASFLEFADTQQLRICTLQTPSHTAIRYVRKLAELPGVFGNLDQAMTLVSFAQADPYACDPLGARTLAPADDKEICRRNDRAYFFGEKTLKAFHAYEEALSPYFKLTPRSAPDSDPFDDLADFMREPVETRKKPPAPTWWLKAVKPLPSTFVSEFNRVGGYLDEAALLSAVLAFEKHRPAVHQRVSQMLSAKSYALRGSLAAYGLPFLTGNIAEPEIRMVDKFLAEHDQLPLHHLRTFAQMLEAVRLLRRLEKDYGRWVTGCAETYELELLHEVNGERILKDEATLRQKCDEISVDMERVLTKSSFGEQHLGGCAVRELVTRGELVIEGERQRHCVGGYASAVEQGVSRIFSISGGPKATDGATLEIRKKAVKTRSYWYEAQLRSFANSQPPHACKVAAKAVIDRLNREDGVMLIVLRENVTQLIRAKLDLTRRRYLVERQLRQLRTKLFTRVHPPQPSYGGGGGFADMSDDVPF
ncbi:PcfJ domain-containing protein [Burkholderia cenocepacia]|uniref:PcfJ domain-containing protein n=1 Tax=Burkholderia cenocepacia TaxID=95486 RepID=UPI00076BFC73|nr:PcfJ domain-containing protein [Burkholderia cenocepacia]KWU17784.1 hypothetical protein AS149_13775 [Burkholderia cenocepacia]